MAKSIEALRRDGIRPGREGLVDDAVEFLSEAAADVLSELAGAIRPDEAPAPAPAAPAPDSMDVDAPLAAETPVAAPVADEEGSVAVGAVGALAAAPAPAPAPAAETPRDAATALADLGVRVDMTSAADNPFLQSLLEVAQASRLVEGVRDGKSDPFSDAEWILMTSLVDYFRNGMPPLKAGSSLRLFLATLLNRQSSAISKKFAAEEMELGKQTFEPQDVDLTKAVRTFQDQVKAFVASQQQDRKYHGVSEEKGTRKNPWRAAIAIPAHHGGGMKFLGYFATKKEAACAVDAFIEKDDRFDEEYVREKSNCIKYKKDFETMNDEMKEAAEVGRSKAEEAPGRLRHRPAAAPGAAARGACRTQRRRWTRTTPRPRGFSGNAACPARLAWTTQPPPLRSGFSTPCSSRH